MSSAFKPWTNLITHTELIFLINRHHEMEMELMEENLKKHQIQIIDNKIIVYKRKKVKIIQ